MRKLPSQRFVLHEVDLASEKILKEELEIHVIAERGSFEGYDEIEVTVAFGPSVSSGTGQAYANHAESLQFRGVSAKSSDDLPRGH